MYKYYFERLHQQERRYDEWRRLDQALAASDRTALFAPFVQRVYARIYIWMERLGLLRTR